MGNSNYGRHAKFSNLVGIMNDIKDILAFLKIYTSAEDKDIELMMDATHDKMTAWFQSTYV